MLQSFSLQRLDQSFADFVNIPGSQCQRDITEVQFTDDLFDNLILVGDIGDIQMALALERLV